MKSFHSQNLAQSCNWHVKMKKSPRQEQNFSKNLENGKNISYIYHHTSFTKKWGLKLIFAEKIQFRYLSEKYHLKYCTTKFEPSGDLTNPSLQCKKSLCKLLKLFQRENKFTVNNFQMNWVKMKFLQKGKLSKFKYFMKYCRGFHFLVFTV